MEHNKTRETWIDIARGILIIFVVMGHIIPDTVHWKLQYISDYIYLFHMPAFFIISGILYTPVKDKEIRPFIIKKIKSLLIPYVSYLFILTIIRYIYLIYNGDITFGFVVKDLVKTLMGGQALGAGIGVLWFLTCLFFVEILWIIIDKYIRLDRVKIFLVLILYVLAHIQAWYFYTIRFPWAVDMGFLALTFYSFGVYAKNIILKKKFFSLNLFISFGFLILRYLNITQYGLELWGYQYKDIILDFLVPISISVVLLNLCYYSSKFKISSLFKKLGMITLPIMCTHPMIIFFLSFYYKSNIIYFWSFTLIALVVPILINYFILEKHDILSRLFLGKKHNKIYGVINTKKNVSNM